MKENLNKKEKNFKILFIYFIASQNKIIKSLNH